MSERLIRRRLDPPDDADLRFADDGFKPTDWARFLAAAAAAVYRPDFADLAIEAGADDAEAIDRGFGAQFGWITLPPDDEGVRTLVLVFRGTDELLWDAIVADAGSAIPWPWWGAGWGAAGQRFQVWRIWRLAVSIAQNHAGRRWRLVITGHSLGGALAQNVALDLARAGLKPALAIAWESPRVGSGAVRELSHRLRLRMYAVCRTHRGGEDPVCFVPPWLHPIAMPDRTPTRFSSEGLGGLVWLGSKVYIGLDARAKYRKEKRELPSLLRFPLAAGIARAVRSVHALRAHPSAGLLEHLERLSW